MNTTIHACLIIIGNEILSGRTKDTNLAWLGEQLNHCGVRLYETRVIPDVEAVIVSTVNSCRSQFDYVFTTGGIGPTHDDITTAAIAKAFSVSLELNAQAHELLQSHYEPDQLNAARLKMAYLPVGATLIANPVSSAPGFQMENVFVMAGVPRIMQAMFDDLRPRLRGGAVTQSMTLHTNLPEGAYAAALTELQQRYDGTEIGSYPHFRAGKISASLVARGVDAQQLMALKSELETMIASLGGHLIDEKETT
ncbi:MAG: competence/damage-inducible protein A [Rickettsiales bacterium]|nr:competence/damage-inducible protein A [Rickettsiales bacterium]